MEFADAGVPPPDAGYVAPDMAVPPPPVGYVRIGPGVFTMGSPVGEPGRMVEEAEHQTTLTRPFLLKATEVTQGEWRSLMGDSPSFFANCGDDCPVEQVSWYEAVAYTNALSSAEGLPRCYADLGGADYDRTDARNLVTPVWRNATACMGYRLPTESEWEYAARAGTAGASYNGAVDEWDCGVDANLDSIAWYCGNSGDTTHPVGGRLANAWGLYDMLGNVWEWTWDWYAYYPAGPGRDYVGAAAGDYRVVRGGSWGNRARNARSAVRYEDYPEFRSVSVGLRPARTLQP